MAGLWRRALSGWLRVGVRGVAGVAATAVLVSVAAQLVVAASPGTPGERAARAAGVLPPDDSAIPGALRADLVARVERIHGLDAPLGWRIARRTAAAARGDFGRSWRTGRAVRGPVARASLATTVLTAFALLFAIALGLVATWIPRMGGRRRRGGAVVDALLAVAMVTPPVWLALLALRVAGDSGAAVLAVATLAILPAAIIGRHASAHIDSALATDWARAARARGLSERQLLLRHTPRELGAELAPLLPGLVGYLLGAAMVIETVFGIRGLGALLAQSAQAGDGPTVVAGATVCAVLVSAAAALAGALARWCDPRLRSEARA